MYFSSHALPLATLFSTIALVSAIPQTPTTPIPLVPASQPTNATNPADPRVCVRSRRLPFSTRYLILRQCVDAINQLPLGDQAAEFRDFDPGDDYYLPQVRKSSSCQVTVSLPYGYDKDISSWSDLRIEATYLADKCCALRDSPDLALSDVPLLGISNKGAYVPTGRQGKIRINLDFIHQNSDADDSANEPTPLSIGGNTTSSTSNAVLGGTTALAIAENATNTTPDAVLAA